jgi:hypothetical protein
MKGESVNVENTLSYDEVELKEEIITDVKLIKEVAFWGVTATIWYARGISLLLRIKLMWRASAGMAWLLDGFWLQVDSLLCMERGWKRTIIITALVGGWLLMFLFIAVWRGWIE